MSTIPRGFRKLKHNPTTVYHPFIRRESCRRAICWGILNKVKDKRMHRCYKRSLKNFMKQELAKELQINYYER